MRGRWQGLVAALVIGLPPLAAQAPAAPWLALDARRTLPGQQARYLKFVEANWVPAREEARRGGAVLGHEILVRESGDPAPGGWDILLITVYRDSLAAASAEEIFAPIIAAREMVRIDGHGPRDLAIGLWSTTMRREAIAGAPGR